MTGLDKDKLREAVDQIRAARPDPLKLKAMIDKYEREFGQEAERLVLEIIEENTKRAWSEVAKRHGSNDIDGILDTLWESFERIGGEFTVERTQTSAQIRCTKCPIADSYLEIGKPEIGLLLHCSTNPPIVAGFNPEMEFRITKRIMSGDDCCDHYYSLK